MRLYCRYRDKELPFAVNLQKSQFVGIVESRAGNVLYPIAEDIAETKYVTINNLVLNVDLQ